MAEKAATGARPAAPDIVVSVIAADTVIGELEQHRDALKQQGQDTNTFLLVERRTRAINTTIRQLAELHGLKVEGA